jgi:Ni/Fe-hydrogenase 1 B-type cytochrome subunit
MTAISSSAPSTKAMRSVFVYEWPVRVWHWLNALCIVVLFVTGYYIGTPFLPNVQGEAVDQFVMGYMRFGHFAAGYVLAVLLLGRLYWAVVGNRYARDVFFPPLFRGEPWADLWLRVRYYLFLKKDVPVSAGANGLEVISMFFLFTLPMIFLILTGFALYAEGAQPQSWQAAAFGWVRRLFGDSQALHTWHHVAMWVLVVFVMVHIYLVIRQDIMSKQSYISTMIGGHRMFKD